MPPLTGIRVLDFTHEIAGPYCTMLLGDMGADVIKVERPRVGDHSRRWASYGDGVFQALNRNKRSLTLNLKDPKGVELAKELIGRADVVVENFSPTTMKGFGLDYESVKGINPAMIYCSLSGFGQTGPYRDRSGWDPLMQAMCGIMEVTGQPDGPPTRVGTSPVDYMCGALAAFAITSALYERKQGGEGQFIDISLYEAAISLVGYLITAYTITGIHAKRWGTGYPSFVPYGVFRTADSQVFLGVTDDEAWVRFCKSIGLELLLEDPAYATLESRISNRGRLEPSIAQALSGMSGADVVDALVKAGIPAGPVNTFDKLIGDPHTQARRSLVSIPHHEGKSCFIPGMPFVPSKTPGSIRLNPPMVGEHTLDILRELGLYAQEVEELRRKGVV